jgi:hypothetical protein
MRPFHAQRARLANGAGKSKLTRVIATFQDADLAHAQLS